MCGIFVALSTVCETKKLARANEVFCTGHESLSPPLHAGTSPPGVFLCAEFWVFPLSGRWRLKPPSQIGPGLNFVPYLGELVFQVDELLGDLRVLFDVGIDGADGVHHGGVVSAAEVATDFFQ
jgi:hypothetical protein